MLRPDLSIPKATKVRELLATEARAARATLLNDLPGHAKISIALDAWTSPNHLAFLAITAYFIDANWKHQEVLLGFEHLHGKHTGTAMATIVKNILDDFQVSDRLFCVITDGAANNGTMTEQLDIATVSFASGFHLPCLAHVIQLVVRKFFAQLGTAAENETATQVWEWEELTGLTAVTGIKRTLEKVGYLAIILAIILNALVAQANRGSYANLPGTSTPARSGSKAFSQFRHGMASLSSSYKTSKRAGTRL